MKKIVSSKPHKKHTSGAKLPAQRWLDQEEGSDRRELRYKILRATTRTSGATASLEERVTDHLNAGWELVGGLTVDREGDWVQALTRPRRFH